MAIESTLVHPLEHIRASLRFAAAQQLTVPVAGGATAAAEAAVWSPTFAGTITSVKFIPTAASTPASGSNSQTLAVTKYDGAGGAGAAVCSAAIANATPTAAFVPFSLGALTGATFAAGNVFSFKTTLAGTATLPSGVLEINYTVS